MPTMVIVTDVTPTAIVAISDALAPRPVDSRIVGA